jgi:TonB family protein
MDTTLILRSLLIGAFAASGPSAQAAKEPVTLKATSKWNVHHADNHCRMARIFGTSSNATIFILNKFDYGDSFSLSLHGNLIGHFKSEAGALFQFGPNEAEQRVDYFRGSGIRAESAIHSRGSVRVAELDEEAQKLLKKSLYIDVKPITPQQYGTIRTFQIRSPSGQRIVLETGALDKVVAATDQCIDRMVTGWGFDPVKLKAYKRGPVPASPVSSWLVSGDYPSELWAAGTRGIVRVRLNVDANGGINGCFVQLSSKPEGFDEAVCKGLKRRAKFLPALDANGTPAPGYWTTGVTFQI